ncbi:MAG: beta strand repeat-containing protein, partial [Pelagibacteraceae bacterium]
IAGSKTATFNDAITATTIALNGSSTLTISYTGAITVAGNITDTSTSNTINVLFATADTAPALVTFSGAAVAADTINIGSTTQAGKATFTGSTGVTATTLTVAGGNHADEDSTATFNDDVTATIVLDDNLGDAKIIFAEANTATITGTINGSATTEGTIQITGATKTFASIIGGTQALTLIDIDGTSIFNAAVRATDIDNDGTATFKSDVTAATANDGTLTLTPNGDNNITHTGAISGAGTLNAVEADDGAVNSVTFSTTVAAATFNIGSTTKSGVVILNGDTTVTNLNIYAGDVDAEDSTVTVNGDLDTTTITLDDGTNSAVTKIIFADTDTVTITGAITAATANDGTIQVTGANKTFSGTIGGTRIGTLDINETSTYTGAVTVNNLDIAASKTATFKNNITLNTSATINSSAKLLVASAGTPAPITVTGSVLGASDGVGTVQITNTGGTTFTTTVGSSSYSLALIDIDESTTFSGSVDATDIN